MSVEWAAVIVSVVVVLSVTIGNAIGAAINNSRIAGLRLLIEQKFSSLHTRLSILEQMRQQNRKDDRA